AGDQLAPAPASPRAGGVCSSLMSSAPGSSTAAHSAAASGATSSGCRQARWSTERGPAARATGTGRVAGGCAAGAGVDRARAARQRDGDRAVGVELLDVRAQRDALARGDRAEAL